MRAERRVGWLGGSFDPVHEGHLYLAREACARLGLEFVWLVPAAVPPHKQERRLAPGADRMALLRLACEGDDRLRPDDLELVRTGLSYSVDTARELRARLPSEAELFVLLGADLLHDLPGWQLAGELLELVTACAVPRAGHVPRPEPLLRGSGDARPARIRCLDVAEHPASSTAIRAALARGEVPEHLPAAVLAEILRRGLYGAGGASSRESSGSGRPSP